MEEMTARRIAEALENLTTEIKMLRMDIREANSDGTSGEHRIVKAIDELTDVTRTLR